jgi:hypothetical protein
MRLMNLIAYLSAEIFDTITTLIRHTNLAAQVIFSIVTAFVKVRKLRLIHLYSFHHK